MKTLVLAIVTVFSFIVIYLYSSSDDEVITIEYTFQLSNNVGRKVDNVEINYNLPLYSSIKKIDESLIVKKGDQGQNYLTSRIENIVAHEIRQLSVQTYFSLDAIVDNNQIANSGYTYNSNSLNNIDMFLESLNSSNTATEFLQKNPSMQAVLFLASTLSEQEQKVRIVSGILFLENEQQKPTCWVQTFKGNQWINITIDEKVRLPFKIMLPQVDISEHSCQNSLIEVWGLDAEQLQVSLKNI